MNQTHVLCEIKPFLLKHQPTYKLSIGQRL